MYYESGKGSTGIRLACKGTEIKATSGYQEEILTQTSSECADGFDGVNIRSDNVSFIDMKYIPRKFFLCNAKNIM